MKTTINQMKIRSNSGHVQVLKRIIENGTYGRMEDRISDIRGLQICYKTLRRWGCLENGKVTATGMEFLKAKETA